MIWQALSALALELDVRVSWRDLASQVPSMPESLRPELAAVALKKHGLQAHTTQCERLSELKGFPCLLALKDGTWVLLTALDGDKAKVRSFANTTNADENPWPESQWVTFQELQDKFSGLVLTA